MATRGANQPATEGERVKRELRERFRKIRKAVPDPSGRSERIWTVLAATPQYRAAAIVLLFDSIPGEPETQRWKASALDDGKAVWVPEDSDLPSSPDLVVVPGIAFTASGDRLGQGGGWYDRYLVQLPASTNTVGVCFADQIVADLPAEPHDQPVQMVISERGIAART